MMMLHQRLFVVCLFTVFAKTHAVPQIQSNGQDINVEVDGLFQVNGDDVGLSKDITSAVAALRDDIVSNVVNPVSDNAATKAALNSLAININATLKELKQAQNDTSKKDDLRFTEFKAEVLLAQTDTLAAMNALGAESFSWKGATVVGNCTAQSCDVVVFGKGFFPSGPYYAGQSSMFDIGDNFKYTVAVTVQNTNDPIQCNVTRVESNFVYCNCVIIDPPSVMFWTNLELYEDNVVVPYADGTAPAKVVQFTTDGPTVTTDSKSYQYKFSETQKSTAPIQLVIISHDPSSTTIAFKSSDQSIVDNNDIAFTKSSTGGSIVVTFKKKGFVIITATATNEFNTKSIHSIKVAMSDFACDTPQQFKATACDQNPPDPYWGRGNRNCMGTLQDGDFKWGSNTATHMRKVKGSFFNLTFSERTVYTVKIFQLGKYGNSNGYAGTGFEVLGLDADTASATNGQWFNIETCDDDNECGLSLKQGISTHTLPESNRRVAGIKLVALGSNPVIFRFLEVQLFGCE